MKIGELAQRIHVSRGHAWRLACAGVIPATKKTKGGHFYFVECPALSRWINFMIGGAFRKKEMKRAYERGYGKETPAQKKTEKEHWHYYRLHRKKGAENRREFKNYINQYDDLFEAFFYDTDDLIRILEELATWRSCKLKTQMLRDSSKRLTVLRDLINVWLNQQQSGRT
jgi:hypothetical protein